MRPVSLTNCSASSARLTIRQSLGYSLPDYTVRYMEARGMRHTKLVFTVRVPGVVEPPPHLSLPSIPCRSPRGASRVTASTGRGIHVSSWHLPGPGVGPRVYSWFAGPYYHVPGPGRVTWNDEESSGLLNSLIALPCVLNVRCLTKGLSSLQYPGNRQYYPGSAE